MNQQINFQNNVYDVLYVNSKKVSCDGGNETSKHPQIYLNMGDQDFVICPYCSKHFVLKNNKNSANFLAPNKHNKKN